MRGIYGMHGFKRHGEQIQNDERHEAEIKNAAPLRAVPVAAEKFINEGFHRCSLEGSPQNYRKNVLCRSAVSDVY